MKHIGIAASEGYAIYPAYRYEETPLIIEAEVISDVGAEIIHFEEAVAEAHEAIEALIAHTEATIDVSHGDIFRAHLDLLHDPELTSAVVAMVKEDQVCAAYALEQVTNQYVAIFESMEDPYIKERAADLKDISKRVLYALKGLKRVDLSTIHEPVILVAHDLTPSDTAALNPAYVKGFLTEIGGRTSHSAIMARTLEIPAVVGIKDILHHTKDGQTLLLDGFLGAVVVDPDVDLCKDYQEKAVAYETEKTLWARLKTESSITKDNVHVELAANIGNPEDVKRVLDQGADGIGLYRTEFLYMDSDHLPTETEQYDAYAKVLKAMGTKPVVIRTLDIGGDKHLSYMQLPEEMNPFLGNRATRLCLCHPELFKTQLRALLKASVHGNLKIMFPMIATVDEFLQVKAIYDAVKADLKAEGVAFSETIELGIMIEIPAAAILADRFAKVVDFFSIGTNDLIQYTFAADRMNEAVSYLYQPFNPSLIRLIHMVIEAAHGAGKWVGMCGEMAGEPLAIPLLLGLGLDEFSMSASAVLKSRHQLLKMKQTECKTVAQSVLDLDSDQAVIATIQNYLNTLED